MTHICRICQRELVNQGQIKIVLPDGRERGPFCSKSCGDTALAQLRQQENGWKLPDDAILLSKF